MSEALHPVVLAAFANELEKVGQLETLRHGWKALKQSVMGGTKLTAAPGIMLPQRQQAVSAGEQLMSGLRKGGLKIHRARVKTPQSMMAKGLTTVPDDLLGMQMYGQGPQDVQRVMQALRSQGATGLKASTKVRPGYHGVNIKGTYQGTPMEMQVSPGRGSTFGSIMEHALGYKQKSEAPLSTAFDKWVGRRVAPRMVGGGSWIPRARPQLQALGAV